MLTYAGHQQSAPRVLNILLFVFPIQCLGTLILSHDSQNLGDWLGVVIYTFNPRTQEDLNLRPVKAT